MPTRYITRTYKDTTERNKIVASEREKGHPVEHDDHIFDTKITALGVEQVFKNGKLTFDTQPELNVSDSGYRHNVQTEYAEAKTDKAKIEYIAKFLGLVEGSNNGS